MGLEDGKDCPRAVAGVYGGRGVERGARRPGTTSRRRAFARDRTAALGATYAEEQNPAAMHECLEPEHWLAIWRDGTSK